MAAHAKLSPSSSEIWLNCAGAIEAQEPFPNLPNQWSADGTVAHHVMEVCLKYGTEVSDFAGKVFTTTDKETGLKFKTTVDDEMVHALEPIIDEIRDIPGEHFYERKVDLSYWLPGQFGTMDVSYYSIKKNTIYMRDLKYGSGVPVSPEENTQEMIYCLGIWDNIYKAIWPKDKKPKFVLIIDQPRNAAGGGRWTISYDDLMEFGEYVRKRGARAMRKGAKRTAGDHCTYCRAAMNNKCHEYAKHKIESAGLRMEMFERKNNNGLIEADFPNIQHMDIKTRARIYEATPMIRQFLNRIHTDIMNDAMAGKETGGWKPIISRKGIRKWRDEQKAERWLKRAVLPGREIYKEPEMVSPAQAEKLIGKGAKKILEESGLVVQDNGKPVLVPESDPRERIKASIEHFEAWDEED